MTKWMNEANYNIKNWSFLGHSTYYEVINLVTLPLIRSQTKKAAEYESDDEQCSEDEGSRNHRDLPCRKNKVLAVR